MRAVAFGLGEGEPFGHCRFRLTPSGRPVLQCRDEHGGWADVTGLPFGKEVVILTPAHLERIEAALDLLGGLRVKAEAHDRVVASRRKAAARRKAEAGPTASVHPPINKEKPC